MSMLRSAAAAAIFSTTAAASIAYGCQTPNGSPCFTIQYEQSFWALVKSPRRDLVMIDSKGAMAVRGDGSSVHRIDGGDKFAVRDSGAAPGPSVRLYLAAGRRMVVHDWPAERDSRLPAIFYNEAPHRRAKPGDADCREYVSTLGAMPAAAGKAKFLGEPVSVWTFKRDHGEATLMVAPRLDCQVLRFELAEYRYRYMPVRKELFEAKSLKVGEPDASLFAEPKPAAKGK